MHQAREVAAYAFQAYSIRETLQMWHRNAFDKVKIRTVVNRMSKRVQHEAFLHWKVAPVFSWQILSYACMHVAIARLELISFTWLASLITLLAISNEDDVCDIDSSCSGHTSDKPVIIWLSSYIYNTRMQACRILTHAVEIISSFFMTLSKKAYSSYQEWRWNTQDEIRSHRIDSYRDHSDCHIVMTLLWRFISRVEPLTLWPSAAWSDLLLYKFFLKCLPWQVVISRRKGLKIILKTHLSRSTKHMLGDLVLQWRQHTSHKQNLEGTKLKCIAYLRHASLIRAFRSWQDSAADLKSKMHTVEVAIGVSVSALSSLACLTVKAEWLCFHAFVHHDWIIQINAVSRAQLMPRFWHYVRLA